MPPMKSAKCAMSFALGTSAISNAGIGCAAAALYTQQQTKDKGGLLNCDCLWSVDVWSTRFRRKHREMMTERYWHGFR